MNMNAASEPAVSNLVSQVLPAGTATIVPGWQTSEFWMTTLGHVGLILAAASGALPAQYAAVAGALSQVAYNLSRGITKANAAR